jgi:hypothetical protein
VDHEEKVPAASIAEVERFWADGRDAYQSSTGAQPEVSTTTKRILIAWIPGINEWRDVYECDHGRYYCLDPGDGLGTHIKDGDGIEVLETTESEADSAMNRWWADRMAPTPATEAQPETIADLQCINCGESAGRWIRGRRLKLGEEVALDNNQRVSVSLSDLSSGALYVFTHQCSTKIDFPGVGAVPLDQASPGVAPRRESAGDGVEVVRPPDPVAGVDYRAIARELLTALYTMIAINGTPTSNVEAAREISDALHHAHLAKIDEVVL